MRRGTCFVLAALLLAGAAHADPKILYVKAHEATLLKEPKATAKEVGKLPFGAEVTWLEAADRPFHKVSAVLKDKKKKEKKVEGYLLQQSLSANKHQEEIAGTGDQKVSAQAFASSGAATKAMSEAGLKYAERKGSMDQAVKGMMSAEAVAGAVTDKDTHEVGCAVNGGCK